MPATPCQQRCASCVVPAAMRRCPRGWRTIILLLSIFIGHRFFLLLFYTNDDRAYVIGNLNQRNVERITTVIDHKPPLPPPPPTTTAKTTTTTTSPSLALEQDYYRRQATVVNPFPYGFLKTPRTACPGSVFLVIVVHSHPSYRDRRDAIRRTWGRYGNGQEGSPRSTRLVFALGVDRKLSPNLVDAENDLYDDIIQGNFTDAYRNMTLKSLLGLKWVSENCAGVPYMLKSDDDMFISIPYLIDILLTTRPKRSIMGPHNWHSRVRRRGKWGISKKLFPFNWYPPYESGSCYVITVDIVRELYETSAYVTPLFIDDVYVTGIIAKIIGATHIIQQGFAYWIDKSPTACDFVTHRKISGTRVTPKLMYMLWKGMKTTTVEKCQAPPSHITRKPNK